MASNEYMVIWLWKVLLYTFSNQIEDQDQTQDEDEV